MEKTTLDALIVDDHLDISLTLSAMLKDVADVNVTVSVDGQDAIAALETTQFDMLFLDLQMPLASGEDVLDLIAAGQGDIQKPDHIYVMSAGKRLKELDGQLPIGLVDQLLEKPFQFGDIEGIISGATRPALAADLSESEMCACSHTLDGHHGDKMCMDRDCACRRYKRSEQRDMSGNPSASDLTNRKNPTTPELPSHTPISLHPEN